jgi:hypothetical protein
MTHARAVRATARLVISKSRTTRRTNRGAFLGANPTATIGVTPMGAEPARFTRATYKAAPAQHTTALNFRRVYARHSMSSVL